MEFKVLAIGDVVGNPGMERVRRKLRQLKRKTEADFVIVNGENASVVGITPDQAEDILDAGADVITLGNHSFGKREIVDYLEDTSRVLRPANLAPQAPGRGWDVYETKAGDVAVVDLIGRCNMDYTPDNPFLMVEKLLKKISARIILVEMHAEATSEKLAMGYMLDGRVSAVWGTHTHVRPGHSPGAVHCPLPGRSDGTLPLGRGPYKDGGGALYPGCGHGKMPESGAGGRKRLISPDSSADRAHSPWKRPED